MYEPTTKKSFQDPALADAWLGCALYGEDPSPYREQHSTLVVMCEA